MQFIDGMLWDDSREVLISDGAVSEDVQRDYDIIWNECSEVSEVL